ncbi:MAG: hypothetical protein Q8Q32_00625 [bacterium]|nr:hypothetical protein [bacterium]
MSDKLSKTVLIIFLLAVVAVQSSGFLSIFNVKINLILVSIVSLSFFIEGLGSYLLLLVFISLIASVEPGINKELIALFAAGLFALFLKRKFFSPSLATNAISILLCTFIFYLIISPSFIATTVFLMELGLNELAGAALFLAIVRLTGENSQRRSN